ncbi:MAG: hypothetical protein LBD30_07185 [Verrucomicrobiales bacterium]|jgi:hypothetical protein|nr:hypothetical protein [Verrucomicrobiales bacterium]
MKTRLILTVSLLAAPLWAQDFQATQKTKVTPTKKNAEQMTAGQPLPVRAAGVVIMISGQGLQVINPLAAKEAGDGRKNVTASYVLDPIPANHEDPKPCGGINIFGWEF